MHHIHAFAPVTIALALAALLPATAQADPAADRARVDRILKQTPLIDGHNDWAEALTEKAGDGRWMLDLNRLDPKAYHTDIERLRAGRVGGQFWSVYVAADLPEVQQVKDTLDQIDLVKRLALRYPQHFAMARTAAEVRSAHRAGRIASLLGAEGGGQIDESLSVLRAYHELGVGYLTLTHFKTISWADSATDDPKHGGLTDFGRKLVGEMNRLGMLVDLSHVSEDAMRDALLASRAPVIFSHSSARALCDHTRNVSDAVLKLVAKNGGVVMVNFAPQYVSEPRRLWGAAKTGEQARLKMLFTGEPDKAKAGLDAWLKTNPEPHATLPQVADHIDHIAKVAGHDNVGLGGDYDGVTSLPDGLDGVNTYPALFVELIRRGWTDADLAKLAGGNILRAMEGAEAVAKGMAGDLPTTGKPSDKK